jgi:hypothetical protein
MLFSCTSLWLSVSVVKGFGFFSQSMPNYKIEESIA